MPAAASLRRFTRRFTQATGLLRSRLYDVDLSLTEARVLYEIARGEGLRADAVQAALGLDKGYLSRIIAGLERRGFLSRAVAAEDRRARRLGLTPAGHELFARIDQRSTDEMERLLAPLNAAQRRDLTQSLATVEQLLGLGRPDDVVTIRGHRIGDMGHIVNRHGVLYAEEYGWDGTFEGVVAEIAGAFLKASGAARQRCYVAEVGGAIAGSATVVRLDDATAKLRIVYVEPWARGRGLGERLVDECMAFARAAGYSRMKLWTNDVLTPARRLYERLGFVLVESEPHRSFGVDLVGEIWARDLHDAAS
jgi:DNA-binding MarR family transcriptional regulator/GNAT superfamily N-acetyltransferase